MLFDVKFYAFVTCSYYVHKTVKQHLSFNDGKVTEFLCDCHYLHDGILRDILEERMLGKST